MLTKKMALSVTVRGPGNYDALTCKSDIVVKRRKKNAMKSIIQPTSRSTTVDDREKEGEQERERETTRSDG